MLLSRTEAEPRVKRHRGEPDVLTSLPPEILDDVLSRLEIRDAIRTSALSRAWRRRWQSVPGLAIWFRSSAPPAAVTSVLERCAAPVRSLTLSIPTGQHRHAARWVRLLPRTRLGRLHLSFASETNREPFLDLEPVFSCVDLADLHLGRCAVPAPPPAFAGFPRLTKLSLYHVILPRKGGALLSAVITAAPLLMDLSLVFVRFDGELFRGERWALRAPNLQSLTIDTNFFDYGLRIEVGDDLPRLISAMFRLDCYLSAQEYCSFFRGVTHVEVLEFYHDSTPFDDNPLKGLSCTFRNLRILMVVRDLGRRSSILSVFSLLRCAPNLESLYIEPTGGEQIVEINDEFLNAQTSDDLFRKLQYVCLVGIMCNSSEMCFIKFVLSKARSLGLFSVSVRTNSLLSYQEACIQTASYKRASPLATLRFEH